jgi:SH3-like domain-containing protein
MRVSWSGASALLAGLLALAALAAAAPASAKRLPPPTRSLCADRVTMHDAPYGYAIGYLYRPQKLAVLGRPVDRWVLIRAHEGQMGWIPKGALCPVRAARR